MKLYEITIELAGSEEWVWWRNECRDFHDAAEQGLQSAKIRGARLYSIERVPDVTDAAVVWHLIAEREGDVSVPKEPDRLADFKEG